MGQDKDIYFKVLLLFLSFSAIFFLNHRILSESFKKSNQLIKPSKTVQKFSLGYDEILADSLWLRLIQDLGVCEQNRLSPTDPRVGPDRLTDCEYGWGYHMIDVITELSPRFKMAYQAGTMSLTVMADDIKGASKIFDKALERFPNDRQLVYYAAAHFLTEEGDQVRAAELFNRAGDLGAPLWTKSLAAKLYSKAGRAEVGKQVLLEYMAKYQDDKFRTRAKERLEEINKILAEEKEKAEKIQ